MSQSFDIAIVGAGAVGGTLAYALSRVGYSVALIERTALRADQQPAFDERHLGFSRSTRVALEGMGLWSYMGDDAVDVSRIHVSSKGQFGSVMMNAVDEGLDVLGHVLPARAIGKALYSALNDQANIHIFAPAELVSAEISVDNVALELQSGEETIQLSASLLIGSDGAESSIRERFQIGQTRWEYDQSAVIANLDVAELDQGLAYERFIPEGAIALLPRHEKGLAVICSVSDEIADSLMESNEEEFAAYIAKQMGSRLADITQVGKRYRFPLALVRSKEAVLERLVLIGNAAHYIHPVAAQGYNLSMRDVSALVEILSGARKEGIDPGSLSLLEEYASWRKQDERIMVAFTDSLIRMFVNPLLPIKLARQKGLLALRYIPGLRNLFTRAVTGRLGRQAGLMRGIPLSGDGS